MNLVKELYNNFRKNIERLLVNEDNNTWFYQSQELIKLSKSFIKDFYEMINNYPELKENYIFSRNYESIKELVKNYESFIENLENKEEDTIHNSILSFRVFLINNSLGFIDYFN